MWHNVWGRLLRILAGRLPWILRSLPICILSWISWGGGFCCNFTHNNVLGLFEVEAFTTFITWWRVSLSKSIFSFNKNKIYACLLTFPQFPLLYTLVLSRCLCLWSIHHDHFRQCWPGSDRKPDASLPVCLPTKLHSIRLPVHDAVHHRATGLHRQPTDCHVCT